ncbi:peptidase S8 and S53 subtilisin kexin sedolisin [Massilia arenosa]|uniref:Peptidase S8 and S53 subtilisin kexin sedolisin n=1 Tax=Zemynaea arenosa TaxID=2561931 RepID=A0A4Y9S0F4_9BURK|nr:S8 family serine peptidase [Massilia arenosa]TFW13961.1 peptidase S8 and S53 subtilisin kexin sedolisin [Massilia arenosa]
MKLRPATAAVVLALSAFALSAHADDLRRPYVVQLVDKPVASYDGSVAGYTATKPDAGSRLDVDTTPVQQYTGYLVTKQNDVLAAVPSAEVLHTYSVVLNGFTAMLTDDEVRTLKARTDVANITPDAPRHLDTNFTPTFLGLDGANGLWSKLGGKTGAGENMIIGVVDGGVWPENAAYADRVDTDGNPTFDPSGTLAYGPAPAGWHGICQTGEGFSATHCNNKLIGARYFDATYLTVGKTTHWTEFRSPRDSAAGATGHGGHGTHTSSTAGGNTGVAATVGGSSIGRLSGMAPRARVAMYKVCWTYIDPTATDGTGTKNSCYVGDSVAAIEQAVVDGVNVINFSISGGTSPTDPVEQAFLHASNAGVFVAASAGNDGPANAVAHISPWLTAVAASTHNRFMQGSTTLGNGASYTGASLNSNALPAAPLILATDAVKAGASATAANLCYSSAWPGGPGLDPLKVTGKVVVCTRGTNDRLDKSKAVKEAGGVGMILVNSSGDLIADPHSVPSVHVSAADGALIKAYAANNGATAAIGTFQIVASATNAPVVADFSSRGPNRYDANVMKPDIAAPGVDIYAGVTPDLTQAQRDAVADGSLVPPAAWASYQGTSMASPHIAGIAALLKQAHPTWSPSMIKSAMMTTATLTYPDTKLGLQAGQLPWGQGAGHISASAANDPGLVYAINSVDYLKYQCGVGVANSCGSGTLQPWNLNLPSLAAGSVVGTITLTRSVTNVGSTSATYTAQASLPGFNVTVSPSTLALAPGQTKSFNVTLAVTTATPNDWKYGSLVWSDGGAHTVKSPIVARAGKPISTVAMVTGDRTSQSRILSVATGFTGKMGAATGGLKEIAQTAMTVVQSAAPPGGAAAAAPLCAAGTAGMNPVPVTVPANTLAASFELFSRTTGAGNGNDDIDMVLINSAGTAVGYSGNGGANETIRLLAPAAGNYTLCLIGYGLENNQSTQTTLNAAVVSTADVGGNFKAAVPPKVYAGSTASVGVNWSGLASGKRYLGGLRLLDQNNVAQSNTLFLVETNNPIPLDDPQPRTQIVGKD